MGIVVVAALAAFGYRLVGWDTITTAVDEPIRTSAPVADMADLPTVRIRDRARASGCSAAVPMWWEVIEREGDDIEAYKAIAHCGSRREIEGVIDDTKSLFEQSRVLAVVPALLDELHVKDLVPILDEVEAKKDKTALDYLFIGRALERLGDPVGAAGALTSALSLDPDNSELHLQLGYLRVSEGRMGEARLAFRRALRSESLTGVRASRLYAVSVAYPWAFLSLVLSLLSLGAVFATRSDGQIIALYEDAIEPEWIRRIYIGSVAIPTLILAIDFQQTGDRAAFAMLGILAIFLAGWLLFYPFRDVVRGFVGWATEFVGETFRGTVYQRLSGRSAAEQLIILLSTVVAIVFFVPLIPNFDARMLTLLALGLLLVSTVGVIILGILERVGSLRVSLAWLSVGGTIPFLLFFLNLERERLLSGWMTRQAWRPMVGYAIVWGVGVMLALLLARILSRSILSPVSQVIDTVEAIREGDFSARSGVLRRDEIGQLAHAVDDMAEGLAQRERIKKTFRQYVDPTVAERLMEGDGDMELGFAVRATVLFSDVRGFTTLSEGLEPGAVVAILNDYFGRMAPIVRRWGGVVDKFIGDGMMCTWDVPEPVQTGRLAGVPGPRLAVQAGVEMLQALEVFNEELTAKGLGTLQIGIGIQEGPVIAGPVGSDDRKEYTVIGDTVNTAARFEGVARGDNPLVIGETVAAVVGPYCDLLELEPMQLKGKAEPVPVWKVIQILKTV